MGNLSDPQECAVRLVDEEGETVFSGTILARFLSDGMDLEMEALEGVEWEVNEDAIVQLEVDIPTGNTIRSGRWVSIHHDDLSVEVPASPPRSEAGPLLSPEEWRKLQDLCQMRAIALEAYIDIDIEGPNIAVYEELLETEGLARRIAALLSTGVS